jgi:gentisate 1,2-dioxygenase
MIAHISEFPVGTYKKAHRHGPGAHVIIIGGKGYSLLWPEGGDRRQVRWKDGSVFVPPEWWWHEHFNSGAEPARYLAIRWGSVKHKLDEKYSKLDQDKNKGGNQIEYPDEDPAIYKLFEQELAKVGVKPKMEAFQVR